MACVSGVAAFEHLLPVGKFACRVKKKEHFSGVQVVHRLVGISVPLDCASAVHTCSTVTMCTEEEGVHVWRLATARNVRFFVLHWP